MLAFKPVHARPIKSIGQPVASLAPSESAPPPTIDAVFAGYEGLPGVLATIGVVAITGAAAYLGIKTALDTQDKTKKALGWVSGVGSALLGAFYLGQKTGLTIGTDIPAVNVYPA